MPRFTYAASSGPLLDKGSFDLVLLQGSPTWLCSFVHPSWLALPVLWTASPSPDSVVPPFTYTLTVSHAAHGGLLDAAFSFCSSIPFLSPSPRQYPSRGLHHVLSTALKEPRGHAVPAPSATGPFDPSSVHWVIGSPGVIDGGGCFPAHCEIPQVRCKSVFSPTKWVIRPLTTTELCTVYDVPQLCLQAKSKKVRFQLEELPFINTCPIRLLHYALTIWPPTAQAAPTQASVGEAQKMSLPSAYPQVGGLFAALEDSAIAVKADDAVVPIHLWDDRLWSGCSYFNDSQHSLYLQRYGHCPLVSIRKMALRFWRRQVTKSFSKFMKMTHGADWLRRATAQRDREVGRECIWRATACDWWEWSLGSSLFYWRWPIYARVLARDGHPVWWIEDPPSCLKPQPKERDPEIRKQVQSKLENARQKRYIVPGTVRNLTSYFAVPKGDRDIRMVYDASKSGLNNSVWVPSFILPQAEALTDKLSENSWMLDMDLGEMFLNFPMHPSVQPYCGIDVRPYCFPESSRTHFERWTRCMMGWKASPYLTIQSRLIAEELVHGNRRDERNAYHWESVTLNLPGSPTYDPQLPWVRKVRKDGEIAGDTPTYVDDVRAVATSLKHCWQLAHQFATTMSYLGIQVAGRKTRAPSQSPGAWAGIVTFVSPEGTGVLCLKDKWLKAQRIISDTLAELDAQGVLEHKVLEQRRGFLNHLQRVYPAMTPFLKGFHLTIDGWRGGRDAELWKLPDWDPEEEDPSGLTPIEPPKHVHPAPRLRQDLAVLQQMFHGDTPSVRYLRSKRTGYATYGFGDASGAGFGCAFTTPQLSTWFSFGTWGSDAEDTSSNYKELRNLTESIELGVQDGTLLNTELFIYTDNMTAEGAYHRGNSDSRLLFDLVVRLRKLDMLGCVKLHLTHIAGTRMIQSGVDGLSRGSFTEGFVGHPSIQGLASCVPLHLSPTQRSSGLLPWLHQWIPFRGVEPLTPEQWFTLGHGLQETAPFMDAWQPQETRNRWFLWDLAPAAAPTAVEELGISRIKRPHLNHVVVCPRLLTQYWRKRLFKIADLVLELPPGVLSAWPNDMHEPLLLGLTLRFSFRPPWQLRQSPPLLALGREVQTVWRDQKGDGRHLLRQLCHLPATLEGL